MNCFRWVNEWILVLSVSLLPPGALAQGYSSPKPQSTKSPYSRCPSAQLPGRAEDDALAVSQGLTDVPLESTPANFLTSDKSTRVGVWGDSHTASGDFMFAALKQWGFAKNHVRPSLIQPAFQLSGVRLPLKKFCLSEGWKTFHAQREPTQSAGFTQTLLQLRSQKPNNFIWLDFRHPNDNVLLSKLQVHYTSQDASRPLVIAISVDNQQEYLFSGKTDAPSLLQINSQQPFATVRLRLVQGQLSIQGFAPLYVEPSSVVLDIFSTPGAMAKVWKDNKPQIVGKPYDTVIFQYGTNEGMASDFNENKYAKELRRSLSIFKALHPKARCIVIGPPVRGRIFNPEPPPFNLIHQSISQVQATVAKEQGCQAWNWQASLQTKGTVQKLLSISPPLINLDMVHLTKEGYEFSGQMFAKLTAWNN
jgi:hypothetical protein